MMIGFGISALKFSNSGAFFVAISFVSSDSQKKVYSDSVFRCEDADDVETFEGEATSFVFSASGIQKKDSSVMDFVRGDTGEEMSFIGGAIRRGTTC